MPPRRLPWVICHVRGTIKPDRRGIPRFLTG